MQTQPLPNITGSSKNVSVPGSEEEIDPFGGEARSNWGAWRGEKWFVDHILFHAQLIGISLFIYMIGVPWGLDKQRCAAFQWFISSFDCEISYKAVHRRV